MVVLLDFSSGGPGELSVRCGQTVELVERSAERPGWCLVRTTDQTPQQVISQSSQWIMNEMQVTKVTNYIYLQATH